MSLVNKTVFKFAYHVEYCVMNNQNKCSEYHTWNNSNDRNCVNHGAQLSPNTGEWWKKYKMQPVSFCNFKYSNNSERVFKFALLSVGIPLIFFCSVNFADYMNWRDNPRDFFVVIAEILYCLLIFGYIFPFMDKRRGNLVKEKDELHDNDYIEVHDKGLPRYVLVARKEGMEPKFGLFDVENVRLSIPIQYSELCWLEGGKMLKGYKNSTSVVLDVNGIIYN